MEYCHKDRKQGYIYVDDGESDMLKRDGNALVFTKCNIDKGNYM